MIYDNPSVISNSIKQFIKNKLIGDKRDFLTGSFEFSIHPQKIKNKDFLKFLLTNYLDELIQSEEAKDWLRQTKRKLNIVCRMAKDIIYRSEDRTRKLNSDSNKFRKTIYENWDVAELQNEFYRILSIPNASSSVEAITKMADLFREFEKRGLEKPEINLLEIEPKKKWWQFWK